jgi:IS30 family transposase
MSTVWVIEAVDVLEVGGFGLATSLRRGAPYQFRIDGFKEGCDGDIISAVPLATHRRVSLTRERGTELAYRRKFTFAKGVSVYFCDQKRPWQRGSTENTNGKLRQYFPNETDLSVHTQADLNQVAPRLKTRPSKCLAFGSPLIPLSEPLR